MTPRPIRRAAERKANKLARKAARHSAPEYSENPSVGNLTLEDESLAIPPAAAANASLSAVTSALTGCATLLPAADATQYSRLLLAYPTSSNR